MEETRTLTKRPYKLSSIFHIIGTCWGSASYGYTASIIGTTLGQPSFITYMKLDTAPNATELIGAMNALFYVGGIFGTVLSAWLANRFGRKKVIIGGALLILIANALQAGSVNIYMFIVFRFLAGAG
jgi:MFS family permease